MKTPVAVFGIKDTFCGQIISSNEFKQKYDIKVFLTDEIPILDEEKMHARNAIKTCEYPRNGMIYGAAILEGSDIWPYLEENLNKSNAINKIEGIFIFEDEIKKRKKFTSEVTRRYGNQLKILSWVAKTAVLDTACKIGAGSIIMNNVYIGYKAEIGDGTTIQTGGIIEHHSKIGNFVNISPGFLSGSFINIEDEVQINIGVTMFNRIKVGKQSCVGAGSLVNKDCKGGMLYFGRPAKARRHWEQN